MKSDFAKRDISLGVLACSEVSLRDKVSLELLRALPLLREKPMVVTADPVFRLRNTPGVLHKEYFGDSRALPHPRIFVALRNWEFLGHQETIETAVAGAINVFYSTYGGSVIFLPFDTRATDTLSDDVSVLRRVSQSINRNIPRKLPEAYLLPGEASSLIGECDLAICMRLHPVILSIKNKVPFVGLAYDQKVMNVLESCDLTENALDVNTISQENLVTRLIDLWQCRERIKEKLSKAGSEASSLAGKNIQYIKNLLDSPYYPPEKYSPAVMDFFVDYIKRLWISNQYTKDDIFIKLHNLLNEQRYKECYDIASQAVSSADFTGNISRFAEFYYMLAYSAQQLDMESSLVLQNYDRALSLGFDPFWVHYNRGQWYLSHNNKMAAEFDLKDAYRLNPSFNDLRKLLSSLRIPVHPAG
jgi:hypothetical protein